MPVEYLPPNAQPSIVSLEKINEAKVETSPTNNHSERKDEDMEDLKKKYGSKKEEVKEEEEEIIENENEEEEEELEEDEKEEERKRIEEAMEEDHYVRREFDHIVVGLIGNPNVGKSTFINAMKGRKVCSTSRTPGHTKWKQTIFLNKDLMLVDCPGLVFPAVDMPKQLQILCGIFPIAQVREPFSAIQYMAKFVPIERIYKLSINDCMSKLDKYDPTKGEIEWSAWMICEAYAAKRGYHTRSGLDVHRAGLEILFDIIDGRLILYFLPNQSSINLGDFSEEKLCNPLISPSTDTLDDTGSSSHDLSSTHDLSLPHDLPSSKASKRPKNGANKLVAVPNAPQPQEKEENDEISSEEEEIDEEMEGEEDSAKKDVAESANPWDVLS